MTTTKRLSAILFLFIFFCGIGGARAGTDVLVLVETADPAMEKTLADLHVPVYYRSDRFVLAGLDATHEALLKTAPVRILDRSPWTKGFAYYWVTVHGTERPALKGFADIQILLRLKGQILIKTKPAAAEQLPQYGYEIARITGHHKPFRPAADTPDQPFESRGFGGIIDTMVASITEAQYTSTIQTLEDFGTRYTYSTGVDNAADWISTTFQGFGLAVERHIFSISSYTKENIIATKTGSVYPDEVVFITAHFDSTSENPYVSAPGADDDGSGTAAVIETARILSNYDFERTIKFACFSGEEQGLVGSEAYVQDIYNAGMNVIGCFNYDMIGYSGTDTAPPDFVIYTNPSSTALAYEVRDAALYYLPSDLEPIVLHESLSSSDHGSFWQYGYEAIVATEDEAWGSDFSPYYHTTSDLVSNCDLTYATNCTKAALAALADYAIPAVGLSVTPGTGLEATGPVGGPFSPGQVVYTLENKEDTSLDYEVTASETWITITNGSGSLAGHATTNVTLSINTGADSLAAGLYTDTIDFVNLTDHSGDTTRGVSLGVGWLEAYAFSMDTDPGWTTQGQWAWGQPTGGGGEYGNNDPTSGHTGVNVYGYNLNGDYANSLSETHLTSVALDCSGLAGTELTFWRWLNVEQPTYDHAYVRISNNGSTWTTVWQNGSEITDSSWTEVTYDISGVADGQSTVYLRWTMGSTDSAWRYSGWNIDDVTISGFGSGLNNDPDLTSPTVTPASGYYGTRFEYNIHYYDEDGDAPALIQVNIDGTDYAMTLDSGTADNGTYRYRTRDLDVGVAHTYYFHAQDGQGGTARNPSSGTLSGPTNYDPELTWSGTPGAGAWMNVEVWGAADALWGVAWSKYNGPFYLPASGLTYDVGPGNLKLAKRIAEEPLNLDAFGYGTKDFQLPPNPSSGIKYIQGTTKVNAFWAKTNFETFIVP